MNKSSEIIVGIDLGTTNSSIAIVEDGVPRVLEIDGDRSVPSCVSLGPDGELLVGRAALNQLAVRPEDTVLSAKRSMGSDDLFSVGENTYRAEEISSIILRYLKDKAQEILDQPIEKAVITVPALFNEQQRAATKHAAELAGLECLRLLNEPTAAALAYEASGDLGEKILVYDLGGGTFDVSLVAASKGLIEVVTSHGDTRLGGDDIDQKLLDELLDGNEKFERDSLSETEYRRLCKSAEQAKIKLSDHPYAKLSEEYLTKDEHFVEEIERQAFEKWIAPLLEKTWIAIHASMHDADVVAADIDKILLVGGSTKIPLVANLIEQKIGLTPLSEINPDLIVAMGAAIQAATLAGEEVNKVLVDISAHTFSTACLEGFALACAGIIKRGTPLPCTKSEVFYTAHDRQEKVKVTAYQGESTIPEENLLLGTFMVEELTPKPMGEPIVCEFSLDLNGMLKVTATEKNSGLNKSIHIDTTEVNQSLDLEGARKKMANLFGEDDAAGKIIKMEIDDSDQDEILARAKSLKDKAENLLEVGQLNNDDIIDIRELLEQSDAAVKESNRDKLADLNERLDDILFYVA